MQLSDVYAFMKRHRYAVISTVGADRNPQSALIGIATTPELKIVFDTLKSSRKYANLARSPRCSLVIGWSGEQTLQYEGMAEEAERANLVHFKELYLESWPDGIARSNWPDTTYFVVHPLWLRYSDYDQRPTFIWEASLPRNL